MLSQPCCLLITEDNLNRAYSPKAVPVSDNPGSFLYAKINPVHKSMTHSNDVIFCHESYFSTNALIGKGGYPVKYPQVGRC